MRPFGQPDVTTLPQNGEVPVLVYETQADAFASGCTPAPPESSTWVCAGMEVRGTAIDMDAPLCCPSSELDRALAPSQGLSTGVKLGLGVVAALAIYLLVRK